MRRINAILVSTAMLLSCVSTVSYADATDNKMKVTLAENDALISGTPGKGWVRYSTIPAGLDDAVMDMVSIGYTRYSWYELEPKEGEYNWKAIDSALEAWDAIGKRFAFGVMSVNTASTEEYVTPKWVFSAGAKYTRMNGTTSAAGITTNAKNQYIPVWDDEVYLQKVSDFTKALAERYDGDERIAFIDIRTYGNYGEGHLLRLENAGSKYLDLEGEKKHIDNYADKFKRTKLIYATANKATHNDITNYCVSRNVGLRYDGICQDATSGILLKNAKDKNTAIFEFAMPYSNLKATKSGDRSWNTGIYIDAFNRATPSYMDFGQYNEDTALFYNDNKALTKQLVNKMGYHFTIKGIEIENEFNVDENASFSIDIENDGATKLFERNFSGISILDENNNEIKRALLKDIDMKTAKEGKITSFSSQFSMADVPDGTYKLAFGMYLNEDSPKPAYKFGNFAIDGTNYYQFGIVKKSGSKFVAEDANVYINDVPYSKTVINNVDYLPIKKTFKELGGEVSWSEESGVEIIFDGDKCCLKDGIITSNGNQIGVGYISDEGQSFISLDSFKGFRNLNCVIDSKSKSYKINNVKYEMGGKADTFGKINDGDFELGSNSWSFNSADFAYSTENANSGKTALKVKNNNKKANAFQSFDISTGNEYEVKFSINDKASVAYSITDSFDETVYSGTVQKGSGEWKDYSFKLGYEYKPLSGSNVNVKLSFTSMQDDSDCTYIDSVSVNDLGTINDVSNGLFGDNGIETSRTKWVGRNGASFERTSDNPHSGALCGVITNREGTWYGGMIDVYDKLMESGPGKYRYEGWFRTAPGDGKMGLTLYSFKINGAIDIKNIYEISEDWTHIVFDSEITEEQFNSTYSVYALIMGSEFDDDSCTKKNIYFDDISLTKIEE